MSIYLRPERIDEALAAMAARELVVVAGATDFYPARVGRPIDDDVLDISAVDGLGAIGATPDGWRIGALVTWAELIEAGLPPLFDGLAAAARTIGGVQIQARGTVVGNVCNASPAADGVPNLLCLEADVELASARGGRRVPLEAFIRGNRRTAREPDELVTGLFVPRPQGPEQACRSAFLKLGSRWSMVISIVMVAGVAVVAADGRIASARVAVGSCSPVARRLPALEQRLVGRVAGPDLGALVELLDLAPLEPIDDIRGSAAYRLDAAATLVRRLVGGALLMTAMTTVRFEVNGAPTVVDAPPMRRLSGVLRDDLGLTGTKVGCDAGDCGACTVRLDGRPVCACLVPVAQVEGRHVETVEGLAAGGGLDRLQTSFLEHGAAQCGICTPGMLMAASSMAAGSHSEADVVEALGGVLCRCTGYRSIIDAVLAARAGSAALPSPRPHRVGASVGARVPRLDGPELVTGMASFGADARPPDALALRVVRSPFAHARFTVGDLTPAMTRPGVMAILTAADVPGQNSFGIYPNGKDQPVLADGYVRYRGEAIMAIVGEPDAIADLPDRDLPVRWRELPPITSIEAALVAGAPRLHQAAPGNVLIRGRVVRGDVEEALAASAVVADGVFETSHVEHAYIEPEAGWARRVGDRLEVFASTQTPYMDRDEVARVVGITPEQVRIIPSACGGGFGGKLDMSVQPLVAIAAWRLGRPVRLVWDRTESMMTSTKRHPARILASIGAHEDGRLTGIRFHGDFDTGAYASWGPTVANRVPVHASGPYAVPTVLATTRAVHTNGPIGGAFRGFGVPQAAIATEGLMDELAGQLGMDPLELRLQDCLRPGSVTATGQALQASAGLAACLEALRPRWHELRDEASVMRASRSGPLRRGVGLAAMWYGIGNTALPNPSTIRLAAAPDGSITLFSGAVDIGQGATTVLAQIAADALGIDVSTIRLVVGDTDRTPDAGKTSASRQTFISGNAVRLAAEELRSTLMLVGPGLADLPVDADGCAVSATGTYDPSTTTLDDDGQGVPYETYAFGAQVAVVDVDVELGTTFVRRIVAAHDVGRAINPTLVEGQIHGGVAQGIGMALMEEYVPGRTDNLHDYLIPTAGDMPEIECLLIEDPEPRGPFGAKGIGEPALIATAPAILAAIHDATGLRVRSVPATPERLRAALRARDEAGTRAWPDGPPGWSISLVDLPPE